MILDSTARLAPICVADALAFEVGAKAYTWDDVVLAAILWGEWQQVRDQVRTAMSSARDLHERQAAPSEEEIERAADEFRYSRDLITSEETEAWLRRRGLDFEELLQYVERRLVQRWSALRQDPVVRDFPTDDGVEAAAWGEAVCSGWLGRIAGKLATRAAVHEGLERGADGGRDFNRLSSERLAKPATAPPHACPLDIDDGGVLGLQASPLQRCQWLRHLDECFNRHCSELLTRKLVRDEIRLHQLDWVRVRLHYVLFDDEDAAREAVLCVRQDRCTLDEAADRAGVGVREDYLLLEQMDEETRGAFLSASQNDLLGPLRWAGKHGVFLLLEKRKASEDDPDAWARAREGVLARLLQQEVERRVRWHERF